MPLVKRILQRGKPLLACFRRPWQRATRAECPNRILVLTRKNYKVYADVRPSIGLMRRMTAVLDTGAGPNLIRKSELPPGTEDRIAMGPSLDIRDANNRPLRTIGLIKLPVRLGRFLALMEFIVCERLAVPLILGASYFDKFVEAIYLRKRKVELADHSEIPIVRRFAPRSG